MWRKHITPIAVVLIVTIFGGIQSNISAQRGAGNIVIAPSWSNDGSQIATVLGNDVEIRNVETNQVSFLLRGHTDFIPMVVWSPDDSMIATPSVDTTVKIWNANNGELIRTFTGHNEWVTATAWSPDGARLLTWGFENRPNLFIWDVATGSLVSKTDSGTVNIAAFNADGQRLAALTSLSLSIREGDSLDPLVWSPRVSCCTNQMRSLAWSPDGGSLVTGSLNGLVTLWDANTAQIVWQVQANPYYAVDGRDVENVALSWVRDVTFTPDGKNVLTISGDGSLRTLDVRSGEVLDDIQIGALYGAAWSPYSGRLAVLAPATQEDQLHTETLFDASTVIGTFEVIVPQPSYETLAGIIEACLSTQARQLLTITRDDAQLADFVAQVETLADEQIPAGCRADVLAIADALLNE